MVFAYIYALSNSKIPELARFLLWVSDFYLFVSKCLAAIYAGQEVKFAVYLELFLIPLKNTFRSMPTSMQMMPRKAR